MESQKDEHVQPGLEAPHHLNGTALLMNARDAALVKRAKLKLDLLLLPILGLFFFLSFLDRANLGLQKDLHMTDYDFSMALTVHKIGAGIQIPLTVTIWGLITCLQGLVTRFTIIATGDFSYLDSSWAWLRVDYTLLWYSTYQRFTPDLNCSFRIALFWGTICISGAASGLLTYAIIKLHGHWGHPGWAWIEGFFTVIFGIIGFFVLPSSIGTVKILTDAEKSGTSEGLIFASNFLGYPAKSTILQVWEAFKSPHVILLSIAQFGCASNIYSLAYFAPTIPPFAVGFIFLVGMSYWSDKRQTRAHASVISAVLSIIGFAIFYASSSAKVRYGSLFISIPGAYAVSPSLGAWTADNSEPHKRKATAIALGAMVANSGGLFSIFVLGKKPRYHLPTAFNIFFGVAIIVCCILNTIWLSHAQKKKAAKRNDILEKFGLRSASASFKQEENESQDQLSEHDMMSAKAWDDLGDQHPDFKYIY
ncbi:hypothetical protein PSHT_12528 [Puccinia striiformis]|uniref:Major facilitator superfamily (MFS) profile domain-containing protein n=1 Tax=Puccinia striiformis TaxID=27350 RepID=A0A2S4UW01_9BASI|nr:hypothetical protein PSHT_12528 [Puccinia striiformis]